MYPFTGECADVLGGIIDGTGERGDEMGAGGRRTGERNCSTAIGRCLLDLNIFYGLYVFLFLNYGRYRWWDTRLYTGNRILC